MESSSIKRIKLEELFLLLIRILIIFFLVILFANPVTKGFLPSWLASDQDSITIFVIDNGHLVEFGTHSNLMQKKNYYAAMVKAQKTNTN